MGYSTGSHTLFHHRYHIVWAPKYRFKVLHGEVRTRVLLDNVRQYHRRRHHELSGEAYRAQQDRLQPHALNLPASAGMLFSCAWIVLQLPIHDRQGS